MKCLVNFIGTGGNSSKYYAAWLTFGDKCLVQLLTVNRALQSWGDVTKKNLTETMYANCKLNFLDGNLGYQ